jgi:hypothetical protein
MKIGAISGGGGLAYSYYEPLILGSRKKRADIRTIYGFLAPTGRFDAGENDNVGSGYLDTCFSGRRNSLLDKEQGNRDLSL